MLPLLGQPLKRSTRSFLCYISHCEPQSAGGMREAVAADRPLNIPAINQKIQEQQHNRHENLGRPHRGLGCKNFLAESRGDVKKEGATDCDAGDIKGELFPARAGRGAVMSTCTSSWGRSNVGT